MLSSYLLLVLGEFYYTHRNTIGKTSNKNYILLTKSRMRRDQTCVLLHRKDTKNDRVMADYQSRTKVRN